MKVVQDHGISGVSIEVDQHPSVIRVVGDLDSFTAGELRERFNEILDLDAVVVDLRQVPFVDSAGLGALIGGLRRLREAGVDAALCCTTPSVLRLLQVTGFDRIVAIGDTPAQAKEMMEQAGVAGRVA